MDDWNSADWDFGGGDSDFGGGSWDFGGTQYGDSTDWGFGGLDGMMDFGYQAPSFNFPAPTSPDLGLGSFGSGMMLGTQPYGLPQPGTQLPQAPQGGGNYGGGFGMNAQTLLGLGGMGA